MILVLQKNTPEPAIRQLLAQLALQNVKGGCVAGETSILLPLVGRRGGWTPPRFRPLPYVQEARRLTPAYHLAARALIRRIPWCRWAMSAWARISA